MIDKHPLRKRGAEIMSVEGPEEIEDGAFPNFYKVGFEMHDGHIVKAIEWRDDYRGDHSIGWYDVHLTGPDGDRLVSINERFAREVRWRLPDGYGE